MGTMASQGCCVVHCMPELNPFENVIKLTAKRIETLLNRIQHFKNINLEPYSSLARANKHLVVNTSSMTAVDLHCHEECYKKFTHSRLLKRKLAVDESSVVYTASPEEPAHQVSVVVVVVVVSKQL